MARLPILVFFASCLAVAAPALGAKPTPTATIPIESASPVDASTTVCTLIFGMRGYSKHFEQAQGRGTITCQDGRSTTVMILGRGANASLKNGEGAFENGTATFSAVFALSALIGSYALPAAARAGGARPMGVAGAMSNGQATITFPLTGPTAHFPDTFGRISIIPHSLSY